MEEASYETMVCGGSTPFSVLDYFIEGTNAVADRAKLARAGKVYWQA
jgi:hypothetical protein